MEPRANETEIVDSLRHSERALDGRDATDRYVEHAKNARAFDAALRARRASIKASYREASLDYLLARKALWLCEFLDAHEHEHPELCTKGPSILLFAREAERRLEREGRGVEVPPLLRELGAGEPRDAVRKKHFRTEQKPAAELMAALRQGCVEPARRAFRRLDPGERAEIIRFSNALVRLIDSVAERELPDVPAVEPMTLGAEAPVSIRRAVAEMLEAAS